MGLSSPCPSLADLSDFLLGHTPEADTARIEAHLTECGGCRERLFSLQVEDDLIRDVRGQAERPQAGGAAVDGLVRAVHQQLRAVIQEVARAGDTPADAATTTDVVPIAVTAPAEPGPIDWQALGQRTFRPLSFHRRGGLGEVYVAEDSELGRKVALKRIRKRFETNADARQDFLREAAITGLLEHPGVVPVYGLVQDANGSPCYAMRFIQGESLKDALETFRGGSGPPGFSSLEFRRILSRFIAVCNTIAYAHSRGVIHRDIKPANIMLGKYGETLVVDWGLARTIQRDDAACASGEETLRPTVSGDSSKTRQGDVKGTVAYMPPEQASGFWDTVGPGADIFSLGATLYQILVGRSPYSGKDALAQARRGEFALPRQVNPRVPQALEAICLKALALRPENRYLTANALADDLERWLGDEPVAVYREQLLQRLGRWGRRHKPLVTGAVALLLTAVVALVVGIVLVNAERNRTTIAWSEEAKRRQQTRAALDAMTSQVMDDLLLRQPELTPAHKRFLEDALRSYEEFAADTRQDLESRAGVARAHWRVARIRSRLEQTAAAEAAFHRAVTLFQALADDYPNVAVFRWDLAQSHNDLGKLFRAQEQRTKAEEQLRAALAIHERLTVEYPTEAKYWSYLAGTHHNLGNLLGRDRLRAPEAEQALRAARALQQRLAAEYPNVRDYSVAQAATHTALGSLLFRVAMRLDAAEHEYRAALDILLRLSTEQAPDADNQRSLAQAHNNLANVLAKDKTRRPDAEEEYRAALQLYRPLAAAYPSMGDYQWELAGTLDNLARLCLVRGDRRMGLRLLEEALPYHRSALKINPASQRYRELYCANVFERANLQAAQADHAAAAALAEELLQSAVHPATDGYNAARIFARCASLAAKDAELPQAKRMDLSQKYADRTVAVLSQGVASGGKTAADIQTNREFDPLRERADFQRLVEKLAGDKAPSK